MTLVGVASTLAAPRLTSFMEPVLAPASVASLNELFLLEVGSLLRSALALDEVSLAVERFGAGAALVPLPELPGAGA